MLLLSILRVATTWKVLVTDCRLFGIWRKVFLTVALAETPAILIVLVGPLLAVLGVVSLLIVLLLLLLLLILRRKPSSKALTGLEGVGSRLKGGHVGAESASLCLAGVLGVDIELLLGLAGQVFVLSSRIVLPRVEVRHGE